MKRTENPAGFGPSSSFWWPSSSLELPLLSIGPQRESSCRSSIAALLAIIIFWLPGEDTKAWLSETYSFAKKIVPLLLAGVFVAGILKVVIPQNFITAYVGGNQVSSNLLAVLFGVFMYFPTLVEVPMARTFLDLGMGKGPLLAYLLADPVISLPSILVISRLIGPKRLMVYVGLIIFFCTAAGLIYGEFLNFVK